MTTWAVEIRLTKPDGEVVKAWKKELDQIAANKLFNDEVEALKIRFPEANT